MYTQQIQSKQEKLVKQGFRVEPLCCSSNNSLPCLAFWLLRCFLWRTWQRADTKMSQSWQKEWLLWIFIPNLDGNSEMNCALGSLCNFESKLDPALHNSHKGLSVLQCAFDATLHRILSSPGWVSGHSSGSTRGGPGGLGTPLAPKIFLSSCSFQAILRENPYFDKFWAQGPPGVKTLLPHLTRILDLPLGHWVEARMSGGNEEKHLRCGCIKNSHNSQFMGKVGIIKEHFPQYLKSFKPIPFWFCEFWNRHCFCIVDGSKSVQTFLQFEPNLGSPWISRALLEICHSIPCFIPTVLARVSFELFWHHASWQNCIVELENVFFVPVVLVLKKKTI